MGILKAYFFLDGPLDVLELCDRKGAASRIKCELEICWKTFSNVQ